MVTSLLSGILASISNTMRFRVVSEYTYSPEISKIEGLQTFKPMLCLCFINGMVRKIVFAHQVSQLRTYVTVYFNWYYCQCYFHMNSYKLLITYFRNGSVSLPALPGIPLRMPARLGRDLRLLLWCIFSMDRYLFLICDGITRFSKSLLWILGTSSNPSFCRSASFIS